MKPEENDPIPDLLHELNTLKDDTLRRLDSHSLSAKEVRELVTAYAILLDKRLLLAGHLGCRPRVAWGEPDAPEAEV